MTPGVIGRRAPLASAGRDPAAQVQVQIYSKLAAALSESGTTAQPGKAILSLLFPGYFVQPHLDPDNPKTQYLIANAFNIALACSWIAEPRAATISDVYKGILDGKEVPLVHLTPEQKEELEKAEAYLLGPDGRPSPAYEEYQRCQLAYFEALDSYEAALATQENGGQKVPANLMAALKAAAAAWKKEGHQEEVELAIATIAQYEGLEPLVYWRNLAARYQEWTRYVDLASSFQYTSTNPPYERWFDEFGWSTFSFEQHDFERQRRAGCAGLQPRCCCACGAEPAGTGAADVAHLDFTDFRLTCKLRRIQIVRPWLDGNVFFSRAWRWSPGSIGYGSVISTGGDIAGAVLPEGTLPVLPTTAIMARDVEVFWSDADATRRVGELAASGRELALGPFRLTQASATQDEHRIWMPDPQVIGFLSTLLPRCPNPEPTLPWPLTRLLWSKHGDDRAGVGLGSH